MEIITQELANISLETQITKNLLNHLYEGIYFVDVDRKIMLWNRGAENITGYAANELVGKYCQDNILSHENEEGNNLCKSGCPLHAAIEKGIYSDARVYLRHKDGSRIPVRVHISPIRNKANEIIGAVEVFIDDSDYEDLKQAKNKLEDLNEQKNQFLGMAAHDLRSPLSSILGFSSFLLDFRDSNLTETEVSIIRRIKNACETMLLLINDLLNITTIETGKITLKKSKYPINKILDIENSSVKVMADQKNIDIKIDIDPGISEIEVDINRMKQVIENMLSNAVKFSFPDSLITIKVAKINDNIQISVIDQGQGIPKKELPNLFKPFQKISVKPTAKEKSTGLGLMIIKKIVELHNGTIKVESKLNKGTTFTIELPAG